MEKTSGMSLHPASVCIGFLDENLERGFLRTLGLLLPCLGGIFCSKISWTRAGSKKRDLLRLKSLKITNCTGV